jgi:hypothetical protein
MQNSSALSGGGCAPWIEIGTEGAAIGEEDSILGGGKYAFPKNGVVDSVE